MCFVLTEYKNDYSSIEYGAIKKSFFNNDFNKALQRDQEVLTENEITSLKMSQSKWMPSCINGLEDLIHELAAKGPLLVRGKWALTDQKKSNALVIGANLYGRVSLIQPNPSASKKIGMSYEDFKCILTEMSLSSSDFLVEKKYYALFDNIDISLSEFQPKDDLIDKDLSRHYFKEIDITSRKKVIREVVISPSEYIVKVHLAQIKPLASIYPEKYWKCVPEEQLAKYSLQQQARDSARNFNHVDFSKSNEQQIKQCVIEIQEMKYPSTKDKKMSFGSPKLFEEALAFVDYHKARVFIEKIDKLIDGSTRIDKKLIDKAISIFNKLYS